MIIKKLKLVNYKKIADCEIDFKTLNVFIGKNNSGKSSLLNVIYNVMGNTGPTDNLIFKSKKDGVVEAEVIFSLTVDEISKLTSISGAPESLPYEEAKFFENVYFSKRRIWRFADSKFLQQEFVLNLVGPPPPNIPPNVFNKLMSSLTRLNGTNLNIIFGIALVNTAGRRLSDTVNFVPFDQLIHSDQLSSFNSWLLHLKRKDPKKYDEFTYEIKSIFPEIDAIDVEYDLDSGRVELIITERGIRSSSNEMGSGWHSVLALYSYMLSPSIRIILLDEPDTHMHAGLVRLLAKFIQNISGTQIIIATHNTTFINLLPISSLWDFQLTKEGRSSIKLVEKSDDVLSLLANLDIVVTNEMNPYLESFRKTNAAQDLYEGLDSKHDVKQQILNFTKDMQLSYYHETEITAMGNQLIPNTTCAMLADELIRCLKGPTEWVAYQNICVKILEYVLSPPLRKPEPQSETEGRLQRRDIVIHIPFDVVGFWQWVKDKYSAIAIIADCKNHADLLTPDEITKTSRYFGENRLGKFGLILVREGVSTNGEEELKRLWTESGIMLIPLSDSDLINMLKLKQAGGKPESVIDTKHRQFRSNLNR